ncbi:peroxide stress protein YaaA, partial [Ilumatobacter sp.]|uniref:peroxide stress protein YaaA n=1 Tax=Ilumatobacter sp. TaxID=1967498 RepID=UPI003C5F84C4
RRLVVVSGLLGLVRGNDPVPDYRLKMGANLAPFGKLSTWWRDELSDTLNRYAAGRTAGRKRVIIDMLPKEHRAAWSPDARVHGVSLDFVDPTGKPGGHFAKAAKGTLARAILDDGLVAVDRWRDDRFELTVTPLR